MLILHSYWTPQFQNFCHFSYMVITLYNLLKKFMLSLLLFSHSTISKFYHPTNWNFFGLVIPRNFFLETGRNYVSIIITIISNIIVCHGVKKKAPSIASPTSLPYLVFNGFVCCFTKNTLSIFLCFDQINTKNNAFLK